MHIKGLCKRRRRRIRRCLHGLILAPMRPLRGELVKGLGLATAILIMIRITITITMVISITKTIAMKQ